jgi:hypothetical protein
MAYPSNIGPYGFLPNTVEGGSVYNGATRYLPIASGYAKNIGYGDPVSLLANGTIARVDSSTGAKTAWAILPIGVFLGCSYTSPVLKYKVFSQYWSTGTTASDAVAIIADDPQVLFKVSLTNAGTAYTSGAATLADVGQNVGYFVKANTGSFVDGVNTATGNSATSVDLASKNTTATLPLRIVSFVQETALSDGTFVEAFVAYTAPTMTAVVTQSGTTPFAVSAVAITVVGGHAYRNPTGI